VLSSWCGPRRPACRKTDSAQEEPSPAESLGIASTTKRLRQRTLGPVAISLSMNLGQHLPQRSGTRLWARRSRKRARWGPTLLGAVIPWLARGCPVKQSGVCTLLMVLLCQRWSKSEPFRGRRSSVVVATIHGSVEGQASLVRCSKGLCHPRISRDRWLSSAATIARCSRVCMPRSVPFGKYWRSSGLVPGRWTPNLGLPRISLTLGVECF
jgi:hypothetical protein